ncbi:alpha/beta family hydrolase [Marinobacterium jannaschii]|uniref:alpha/beta family hydrolase n=1 Tax=Marinobacterium jannaschii TaxID=64970 RepID=UPI00047F55E3|nr:alpha/beta family hydrolase [Marinobacterium jannaschii]
MIIQGEPGKGRVFLAHGAGAGMESDFLQDVAQRLVIAGFQVVRFNFPYMERICLEGKQRPPDRLPKLIEHYKQLVEQFDDGVPAWLAGKSMGGRVATHCLDLAGVQGALVFGYPFHPAGKPEKLRIDHLGVIDKPVLIFQGTRDKLGSYQEVLEYALPSSVHLCWAEDGDHDLKPRKSSGFVQSQHLDAAVASIEEFIR